MAHPLEVLGCVTAWSVPEYGPEPARSGIPSAPCGIFFTRVPAVTYELHNSLKTLEPPEEPDPLTKADGWPVRPGVALGITVAYKNGTGTRVATLSCAKPVLCSRCRRHQRALAEDPPFGGLWCDQPAPFFTSPPISVTNVLKSTGLG